MKRFLIGQFNHFDMEKQNRDFREYFWGNKTVLTDILKYFNAI